MKDPNAFPKVTAAIDVIAQDAVIHQRVESLACHLSTWTTLHTGVGN